MHTMPKDGGVSSSLWIDADVPSFESAPGVETDVCVVGAGIAGLTTAFELARKGVQVTVLDDGPIGGGETGRTSAHLASAVDDRYDVLEHRFGADGARMVADSHATAIDYIEAMIDELGVDCEFQRVDGFLFADPDARDHARRDRRLLEREHAAARRAGLPCELVAGAPLTFDTGPALRFPNQAELHPLKYLRALVSGALRHGADIHTGVHVDAIEPGEPLRVHLSSGRRLLARRVVDATNGAFTSPIFLPLRQAAYRTYVLAFAIPTGVVAHALYWDLASPYHYVRVAPGPGGGEVLLVGGADHRVGQDDTEAPWRALEAWARTYFPFVNHIVARWSGQVIEPADALAHIGESPDLDHVYVITGDSGNGLTHGTIGGLMITEMLLGRTPAWSRIYAPARSHLHAFGRLVREAVRSAAPYAAWMRSGDVDALEDIPHGEGAVIRRGVHLVAAYRDERGTCHLRSATCPHLRGVVGWNAAEKTWDCPCHGSRFDRYGRVLNGPSASDLAVIEPAYDRLPARPIRALERFVDSEDDLEPVRPDLAFDPER